MGTATVGTVGTVEVSAAPSEIWSSLLGGGGGRREGGNEGRKGREGRKEGGSNSDKN